VLGFVHCAGSQTYVVARQPNTQKGTPPMPQRRRLLVATIICLATIAALLALSARQSNSESSGAVVPTADSREAQRLSQPTPSPWEGIEQAQAAHLQQQALTYLAAVEQARQAAAAEHERQHREDAARQAAAQQQSANESAPVSGDVWYQLAMCETGGKMDNPNTGNGYYGYFQFSLGTWESVGGPGYPHHHSYETQKAYAQKLQARSGWGQWPACSRKLGLR
jgi:hypothetical protein